MALDLTKYLTQEQIAAKIKDCQSNWAFKILELDLAKKATLYVESGALKYRGSSGTITTIANA